MEALGIALMKTAALATSSTASLERVAAFPARSTPARSTRVRAPSLPSLPARARSQLGRVHLDALPRELLGLLPDGLRHSRRHAVHCPTLPFCLHRIGLPGCCAFSRARQVCVCGRGKLMMMMMLQAEG